MGKKRRRQKDFKAEATDKDAINIGRSNEAGVSFSDWRHIVIIAVVAATVYSNTLFMDFVSDDLYQVKENTLITSLRYLPEIFTTEVWRGVKGGDNLSPYYRPIFTLSYLVDYLFWGKRPFGYHLTNLLLHVAVSLIIYFLSIKFLSHKGVAFLSSLLFSVHPVHSEAISWIAARNEPLAALFMLSSFYFYILFREEKRFGLFYISLFLYLLALLSKEMAVTMPLLILFYEICFGSESWNKKIKWPLLFLILLIPYFIVRSAVLEVSSWQSIPLLWRVNTGIVIVVKYLKLLIFPFDLKVYYDIPIIKNPFEPQVILSMIILAIIFVSIFIMRRRNKIIFFFLLWIFITIIPVSGIPTLILPSPMAERYLYIPSIGFVIALSYCMVILKNLGQKVADVRLSGHVRKVMPVINTFIIFFIGLLFILNYQRNYVWKDQLSYATMVVKDAPNSPGGHNDLGVEYAKQGRIEDAIRELRIAINIKPDFSEALSNLSALYRRQKRYNDAIETLQASLRLKPRNVSALNNLGVVYTEMGRFDDAIMAFNSAMKIEKNFAEVHNNLGVVYLKQDKLEEALKEFGIAIQLEPNYAEAYNNLGVVHLKKGELQEAKKEFQNALKIMPGYKEALDNLASIERYNNEEVNTHYNLGNEFLSQGRFREAIDEFKKALKQRPADAEIHNNLGAAYIRLGQIEDAAGAFEMALRYKPDDAAIHYNLGVVYMKQGKASAAIKHLEKAVNLVPERELFKKTLDRAYKMRNDHNQN